MPLITNFYDQEDIHGLTFLNYMGKQRVRQEMVNILLTGGNKYGVQDYRFTRKQQRKGRRENKKNSRRRRKRPRPPKQPNPVHPPLPSKFEKWKPLPSQVDAYLISFIGYGNANFGRTSSIKGKSKGIPDLCKMLRKLNGANKIVLLEIYEYLTSKVC
ncbi:unnamed protein product [Cunninghamella blakesleeana]